MIRQGDYKLVLYAENQFGEVYPAQLFHLPSDPWELRDVSRISPSVVARLSALLGTVLNTSAVDARVKEVQKALFTTYAYEPAVANSTVVRQHRHHLDHLTRVTQLYTTLHTPFY